MDDYDLDEALQRLDDATQELTHGRGDATERAARAHLEAARAQLVATVMLRRTMKQLGGLIETTARRRPRD